jgi:outer membrane protein OmpA-like peptidoglycan-associated protein
VPLAFPKGSAVLPPEQAKALIALARRRGAHGVEAIGYGEAANDTVQTQSDALQLALERARAISAALIADGVPAAAIRLAAKPAGDGGAARLLD